MRPDYQENAVKDLTSCIGKYITIYHKYKQNSMDANYTQDICVAKVISVTRAQFLSLPVVKIQFCDGTTAELTYRSNYGHVMFNWDYRSVGYKFNDMFVAWSNGSWDYTYSAKNGEVDYFLTTGDLFVKFFEDDEESRETILFYNETLSAVHQKHNQASNTTKTTPIRRAKTTPTTELDSLFLARA